MLQPAWPLFKRLYRWATLLTGVVARRLSRLVPGRALPQRSHPTSAATAAAEPDGVRLHRGSHAEQIRRQPPAGDPAGHWRMTDAREWDVPEQYVLEMAGGAVAGDWGAVVTPGGALDIETSEYFGIESWREHPVFLASKLPPVVEVDGPVVALSTRGGNRNYYHFLMDVLPRWGVFTETVPGVEPDAIVVSASTRYEKELLALTGLDRHRIIEVVPQATVRSPQLYVPCLQNPREMAPRWTVQWLRAQLPPQQLEGRPKRLYVTRLGGRNTRRLVQEEQVWAALEERGFVRIDPGTLTVQEQIDHFAAAEVVVGLHGGALANLLFCSPGARVLEIFPVNYVKHCYWSICASLDDVTYEYVVAGRPDQHGRDNPMTGIQADIDIDPARVVTAVDRLLVGHAIEESP
ncbi:hypothetical protein GCM10025786_29950 [Nocardioides caeni]